MCIWYILRFVNKVIIVFLETKKNKKDTDRSKAIYKTNFRLKGQFGENTGIVAVKPHWGAVCAERFTDHDARVVCREILDTE